VHKDGKVKELGVSPHGKGGKGGSGRRIPHRKGEEIEGRKVRRIGKKGAKGGFSKKAQGGQWRGKQKFSGFWSRR